MESHLPSPTHWIYRLLVGLIVGASVAHSDCPPALLQEAKACSTLLGSGFSLTNPQSLSAGNAAEKAVYACGNGDFFDVVSCMERVVNKCSGDTTDTAHFLRSMINSTRARNAIRYFCNNVQEFASGAPCLGSHHQMTVDCARPAILTFHTQHKATDNLDAQMRFSCSLYEATVSCTAKTAQTQCSEALSDIVYTVLAGFEPPICRTMTYRQDGEVGSQAKDKDKQQGENGAAVRVVRGMASVIMVVAASLVLSGMF